MKLTVVYQDHYSRSELLLRTIFGIFYIILPHLFLFIFMGLWGSILSFIALITILFTGRYPQSMFEYQVQLLKWQLRLSARMQNLSDGYPSFGLNGTDEYTSLEVE